MKCPKCGKNSPFITGSFCSYCGALLTTIPDGSASTTKIHDCSNSTPPPVWESSMRISSPFAALYNTFIATVFYPSEFFANAVMHHPTLLPALWYGLICGGIGVLGTFLWNEVFQNYGIFFSRYTTFLDPLDRSPSSLIAAPILLITRFYILAFYTKFAMHFKKNSKPTCTGIVRILCYAESASIFAIIPVIGSYCAFIFRCYLILIGYYNLYGVSKKSIFFSLITPLFIILILFTVLLIIGMIAGIIAGASFIQHWIPLAR